MKTAKILILPALLAFGCDDGGKTTPADMAMPGPDMAGPPARPALGDQIDRMGRPAINTALTDPFNFDKMHDAVQDDYNKNGDPSTWATKYAGKIAGNLAILDVLDGKCGNQALYNTMAGGANFSAAGYSTLAGVLAGDELLVQTGQGTCKQYLAAELSVITAMPVPDCGGRAPTYDVIDWSYGVLSGAGKPVSDGVNADSDGSPNDTTFPFLGAPNQ